MSETAPEQSRLFQISEEIRDGWVRGRGPLTGLKKLIAVRVEVVELGADEAYLALLDKIIASARAISKAPTRTYSRDTPAILERDVALLQAHCLQEAV